MLMDRCAILWVRMGVVGAGGLVKQYIVWVRVECVSHC